MNWFEFFYIDLYNDIIVLFYNWVGIEECFVLIFVEINLVVLFCRLLFIVMKKIICWYYYFNLLLIKYVLDWF